MIPKAFALGLLQALTVLDAATATPLAKRELTCNTPDNRACWRDGFDIMTDWEENTPLTDHTLNNARNYTLVLEQHERYTGPDGHIKNDAMLFNDWGDWINVTVINKLPANGTSIHWHGIRMLNNNINDGVNGITECPIPPNGTKSYVFLAQQYGTTWYHSHHSSQYGNGVFGPLVINGPASANYHVDLGTLPINDWYYDSADVILNNIQDINSTGPPPPASNILFNGTHIDPDDPTKGTYAKVVLTPGLKHRLRLINPSVDYTFTFTIVGHNFTVIANDLVPLDTSNNTTVSSIFVGIGQRYDVIIQGKTEEEIASDLSNGNYWINATLPTNGLCGAYKIAEGRPAAILRYDYPGAIDQLPNADGPVPEDLRCEDRTDFMPVVPRTIPETEFSITKSNTLSVDLWNNKSETSQVYWRVNKMALNVTWEKPILEYVRNGSTSWPKEENLLEIPRDSQWSFWLIENESGLPHPMHLHGHDFVVIGRSPAEVQPVRDDVIQQHFDPVNDTPKLNFTNPTRRDATMLPGKGWLIVAFRNDNPGAWLFHCHIAWHASLGLSVQFLERADEIHKMDLSFVEDNCKAWQGYIETKPLWHPKNDSGI
ncbi:multicopper oxidase-domain-containing protein [Sordaria sp. MPI-SDFR-AT-0083]|nr:multicopper oxidase-domain-containing protein [Sordaria sp. MPI-SDFR-AT-0083]